MPSIEEAEYEDSEGDSPIMRAEIMVVVKKKFSGRAPEVDVIHLEFLKALDVEGAGLIDVPFQRCVEVGDTAD